MVGRPAQTIAVTRQRVRTHRRRRRRRSRTSDPIETLDGVGRSITPTATTPITITTASATAAVKTTTSEAARAGYPRLGFIHRETTPIVILIMESLDRCLCLSVRLHLDEAEALAAARLTVCYDLSALHGPELSEPPL